jgi:hypothetical protein
VKHRRAPPKPGKTEIKQHSINRGKLSAMILSRCTIADSYRADAAAALAAKKKKAAKGERRA